MAYLRLQDYLNFRIQEVQLNQITQNNDFSRLSCELESQSELISYLVQKYDVEEEFRNTFTYSYGKTYYANNLSEISASNYSASNTYTLHSLTNNAGNIYVCTTAITTPEAFNSSHWKLIGKSKDLFFVMPPASPYSYKTAYQENDLVYYKNKIYKCRVSNTNVMPTDVNQGKYYWFTGVDYSFTGVEPYNVASDFSAYSSGTTYSKNAIVQSSGNIYISTQNNNLNKSVTDINYFLPIKWGNGDNRSQQLVAFMVDLVLYKLHMRIAPQNIPQLRKDNYNYAIQWLLEAGGQNNSITADIPLLQPKQGGRIRWGSNTRNINNY